MIYEQVGIYIANIHLTWSEDRSDLLTRQVEVATYIRNLYDSADVRILEFEKDRMTIYFYASAQTCDIFVKYLESELGRIKARLEEIFGTFNWGAHFYEINNSEKTHGMPEANMGYRMPYMVEETNHAHYLDGF